VRIDCEWPFLFTVDLAANYDVSGFHFLVPGISMLCDVWVCAVSSLCVSFSAVLVLFLPVSGPGLELFGPLVSSPPSLSSTSVISIVGITFMSGVSITQCRRL